MAFFSPFWTVASNGKCKDYSSLPICHQRKGINGWEQKFLFMLFALLASFAKMLHEKLLVWTWNRSLFFYIFLCCAKHLGICHLHFCVRPFIHCMALQHNIVLCLSFCLSGGLLLFCCWFWKVMYALKAFTESSVSRENRDVTAIDWSWVSLFLFHSSSQYSIPCLCYLEVSSVEF